MEHDVSYDTLDELVSAMQAAELLGFEYRTRTIQATGFGIPYRKYIISVVIDKLKTN